MKRLTVLICILTCFSASGRDKPEAKAAISADLTSIIVDWDARIGISHCFAGRWSAEGSASFRIPRPESGDAEKETVTEGKAPEFRMGIRFWAGRYMEGGYLGIHCSHSLESGTDMVLDCGYSMKISASFGLVIGYETWLLKSIKSGCFTTEGIKAGINIIF